MAAAAGGGVAASASDTLFSLAWATEAASTIDKHANFDRNLPDLGKLICGGGNAAAVAAVSGPNVSSHNYSYRPYTDEEIIAASAANGVAGFSTASGAPPSLWKQQLVSTGFYRALPRRVRELAGNEEFASLRGLWAEIHRAWVTCDDRLLIWNYEASPSSSSSSSFDDSVSMGGKQPLFGASGVGMGGMAAMGDDCSDYVEIGDLGHVITSVNIVVPRNDFFAPAIKYLLVVATTAAVHLYALSFDDGNGGTSDSVHGRLHVHNTHYVLPTDGVTMHRIVGTSDGRIFCCGRDGGLHEVVYAEPSNGSSKRWLLASAAATVGGWIGDSLGFPGSSSSSSSAGGAPAAKRARRVVHSAEGSGDGSDGGGGAWLAAALKIVSSSLFTATPFELQDAVVDHDRRLLYTLGTNGSLRVYSTGQDPSGLGGFASTAAAGTSSSSSLASSPGAPLRLLACINDLEAACQDFCNNRSNYDSPHPAPRPRADLFKPGLPARAAAAAAAAGAAGGAPPSSSSSASSSLSSSSSSSMMGLVWPVASMSVVRPTESSGVHLVLTSAAGVRLYLTTLSAGTFRNRHCPALVDSIAAMYGRHGGGIWGGGGVGSGGMMNAGPNGLDGIPGGVGSSLTVLHVAMPPPTVARSEYTSGLYAQANPAAAAPGTADATASAASSSSASVITTPDGAFAPQQLVDHPGLPAALTSSLAGVLTSCVGDGVSIVAAAASSPATGGAGGRKCRLVALAHDSLRPRPTEASAAAAGGAAAGGAADVRSRDITFRESVQELDLPPGASIVYAVQQEPLLPSLYLDAQFTETGALALSERETCLAPGAVDSYNVRSGYRGRGTPLPNPETVRTLALAPAGGSSSSSSSSSSRVHSALGAAPTYPDLCLSLVTEDAPSADADYDSLSSSGCAPRFHHVVRRRLWGASGPSGSFVHDLALQVPEAHAVDSSLRVFVVLTDTGVVKFTRRRLIDQVAALLRTVEPVREAMGGAGAGNTLGANTMRLMGGADDRSTMRATGNARAAGMSFGGQAFAFLSQRIPAEELGACLIALSCGTPDIDMLKSGGGGAAAIGGYGSALLASSGVDKLGGSLRAPRAGRVAAGAGGGAWRNAGNAASAALSPGGVGAGSGGGPSAIGGDNALSSRADKAFNLLFTAPRWQEGTRLYDRDSLLFSVQVEAAYAYASRLMSPFLTHPAFIEPLVKSAAPITGLATRIKLLPRYNYEEALSLQRSLASLLSFVKRHFTFVDKPEVDLLDIPATVGLPALPGQTPDAPADSNNGADLQLRANSLEILYVLGLSRFLSRALQVAALLAEIAKPVNGGVKACDEASSDVATRPEDLVLRNRDATTLASLVIGPGEAKRQAEMAAINLDWRTSAGAAARRAYLKAILLGSSGGAAGGKEGAANAPGGTVVTRDIMRDSPGRLVAQALLSRMLGYLQRLPGGASGAALAASTAVSSFNARVGGTPGGSSSSAAAPSTAALAAVDPAAALASSLRSRCPAFFSEARMQLLLAESEASAAERALTSADREARLETSLRAAIAAVKVQDPASLASSLPEIASLLLVYGRMHSYLSVLQLVCVAGAFLAGGASAAAELPSDYASVLATDARLVAYTAFLEALQAGSSARLPSSTVQAQVEALRQALSQQQAQNASLTGQRVQLYGVTLATLEWLRRTDGSGAVNVASGAGTAASASLFMEAYGAILPTPDALLHDSLYRWLVASGLSSLLIQATRSRYVETFLAQRSGDPELLVSYYKQHAQAGKAARRLAMLALTAPNSPGAAVLFSATLLENGGQGGAADAEGDAAAAATAAQQQQFVQQQQRQLDITTRLSRLQKALALAQTPRSQQGSDVVSAAEVQQWKGYLQAMEAQSSLAAACERRRDTLPAGVAEHLRYGCGVLTLNELYDVARQLPNMYDQQLLILNLGEHSDQQRPEVHRVWEAVVENALIAARDSTSAADLSSAALGLSVRLSDASALSADETAEVRQMKAVDAVVRALGTLLWANTGSAASSASAAGTASASTGAAIAGEPFAFPLGYLADLLELRVSHDFAWPETINAQRPSADSAGYNPGWLSVDCLSGAGVPWTQRFDAYSWLLGAAAAEKRPLSVLQHLAAATVALVRAWIDSAKSPMAEPAEVRDFVAAATVGGLAGKLQEIDRALSVAAASEGAEADKGLRQLLAKTRDDVAAAAKRLSR